MTGWAGEECKGCRPDVVVPLAAVRACSCVRVRVRMQVRVRVWVKVWWAQGRGHSWQALPGGVGRGSASGWVGGRAKH